MMMQQPRLHGGVDMITALIKPIDSFGFNNLHIFLNLDMIEVDLPSYEGKPIPFKEALAVRLNLFKPSLVRVQDFLEKRPQRLLPRINDLVHKLKESGKTAYLIYG
ncbi:hypothetical protein Tco_0924081 [Tanacetum coccineum]|uniref:Uncharacterized protein n=1 Tax=Tanacetum coccineum TaxID=301880 RepID=A0ABQ5D5J6_9ASTR